MIYKTPSRGILYTWERVDMSAYSMSRTAYNYLIRKGINCGYINADNRRPVRLGMFLSDLGEAVGPHNNVEDLFYDNRHDDEKELDEYRIKSWKTPVWNMGYIRRHRSIHITDRAILGLYRTAVAMKIALPAPFNGPNINHASSVVGAVLEAIGVEMLGVKRWPMYDIARAIRKEVELEVKR